MIKVEINRTRQKHWNEKGLENYEITNELYDATEWRAYWNPFTPEKLYELLLFCVLELSKIYQKLANQIHFENFFEHLVHYIKFRYLSTFTTIFYLKVDQAGKNYKPSFANFKVHIELVKY